MLKEKQLQKMEKAINDSFVKAVNKKKNLSVNSIRYTVKILRIYKLMEKSLSFALRPAHQRDLIDDANNQWLGC